MEAGGSFHPAGGRDGPARRLALPLLSGTAVPKCPWTSDRAENVTSPVLMADIVAITPTCADQVRTRGKGDGWTMPLVSQPGFLGSFAFALSVNRDWPFVAAESPGRLLNQTRVLLRARQGE